MHTLRIVYSASIPSDHTYRGDGGRGTGVGGRGTGGRGWETEILVN